MDQNFVVSLARFHATDSHIYVLQGYFLSNTMGESRLCASLDGRALSVRLGERSGLAVRQKYFARGIGLENIDREYDLWIELPPGWEQGRRLQVDQIFPDGRRRRVWRVHTARLKRERTLPDGYLETFREQGDHVCIGGWAVADAPCRFRVEDGKGRRLTGKLTRHYRQDIVDTYPELQGTDAPKAQTADLRFGYELSFPRPDTDTVTLVIGTTRRHTRRRVHLKQGISRGTAAPSLVQKTTAYLRRYGLGRTARRAGEKLRERLRGERESYMSWRRHALPSKEALEAQRTARFEQAPLISIVVPLYRTDEKLLQALTDSVLAQTYSNWELCLSDGSGADSPLKDFLGKLQSSDQRIRVIDTGRALRIAENTNQALTIARGDWVAFADHDDLLPPWALYECVRAINDRPRARLLYSDEDKVSMDGRTYFQPHFKSDLNIDLLTSMNYFCHLVAVRADLLEAVRLPDTGSECAGGWFDPSYDGAQDYDFVLRCVEDCLAGEDGEKAVCHIPRVLYHWRSHPDSTAENPESKRYAFEAGQRAVQAHFDRIGVPARVHMGAYPGLYRVEYLLPEAGPLVSIIIPNKDHAEDLRKCVSSLMERSSYRNFELIVVENGSVTGEIFDYYRACEEAWDNFRVLRWTEGFNYSAINNFGAAAARGEYLLFLNNDTELTEPDLIGELLGPCLRPEVGAVGAKLLYEDGTIQHAGVIMGYGGIAGHAFQGMPGDANGYFSRIICQSDLSAVTAACVMVKRSAFERAGGFDPTLAVAFNDIDLCLKLRREGYLVVYNPFATMHHYESKSRGMEDTPEKIARFNREADILLGRWEEILKNGDPYYNPNLSLDRVDFGLKKV